MTMRNVLLVSVTLAFTGAVVSLGVQLKSDHEELARLRTRLEQAERVAAAEPWNSCMLTLYNTVALTAESATFSPRADGGCYGADWPQSSSWVASSPAPARREGG